MGWYEAKERYEDKYADEIVTLKDGIVFYPGYEGNPGPDEEWYDDPGYPDLSLGEKVSEITGNLKEMVLKRVGIDTSFGALQHKVVIIESHENGGYCGTCAFEIITFTILVDDEEVYREGGSYSPFEALQYWLTEEE